MGSVLGAGSGEGQLERGAEQTGCAPLQSDALLESVPTSVCVSSYESLCVGGAAGGRVRGGPTRDGRRANWTRPSFQSDALLESVPTSVYVSTYESVCVGGLLGGGSGEGQPEPDAELTGCALLQSDALLESVPTSVYVSSYESVCVGSLLEGGSGEGQPEAEQTGCAPLQSDALLESVPTSVYVSSYGVCVRGEFAGGRARGGPTREGRRANWTRPSSIGCSSRFGAYICLCVQLRVCVRGGGCWGEGQGRVNQRGTQTKLDASLFNRMLF